MPKLCLQLALVLFAATIIPCAGCGSGNPWEPIAVSGKVAYEDGSAIPVNGMKLYFKPQTPPIDAKTFPREGAASVGPDGAFANATTYKYADGLIPGKHKVMVVAYAADGRKLSPAIPKEFTQMATTPLEVDTDNLPLEIKIRKP